MFDKKNPQFMVKKCLKPAFNELIEMASTSRRRRNLCLKCEKTGILSCHGCKNDFCYLHVNEHRDELNEDMEHIVLKRDQLQEIIAEQKTKPDCHPLIERINQWEIQSIMKIRQSAHEIRRNLLNMLDIQRNQVSETLFHLTEELNQARKENDYVETDLKEWMRKFKQLKKDLFAAHLIRFTEAEHQTTLVSKISIDHTTYECFDNITGDIEVSENGKIVEHGPTNTIAIARGRGDYASNQHRLHFQLTHLSRNDGFYFGIVSKNVSNQSILRAIPTNRYLRRTSRNEDKHGFVYFNKIDFDMKIHHTLELLIDCDEQKVYLKDREQCQNEQEMFVDVNQCPFPWQFFVCLLHPADRVVFR